MAKRTKTRERLDPQADAPATPSPFAGLAGLRDNLPPGDEPDKDEPAVPASATFAAKVVLRYERKGHGGKTVTVLSGVLLIGEARTQFMRELGQTLGTHVRAEGHDIVLAGDQRDRASTWLEKRGARRVITSG